MVEVSSQTFAERLLRSAEEAAAIKRGDRAPARRSRRKITAREATVAEPPVYDAARISRIRKSLSVSQPVFAAMLGIRAVTLQKYEQGENRPAGPVRRLLEIVETQPEILTTLLEASEKRRPTRKRSEAGA